MSALALASVVALTTVAAAAVSRRPGRTPSACPVDQVCDPLGVSESDIVRDLAASFETREG